MVLVLLRAAIRAILKLMTWFPDTVSSIAIKCNVCCSFYFFIPFSSFNKFLFSDFPMFHVARPLHSQGLLCWRKV